MSLVSFNFIAGVICTLACLVLLLPWLRTIPGLAVLPVFPWHAGIVAMVVMGAVFAASVWRAPADQEAPASGAGTSALSGPASGSGTDGSWSDVAAAWSQGLGAVNSAAGAKAASGAQSMEAAITALQTRLAKSGGSSADWELLAKSYEFLGQLEAAGRARAHQIPPASAPAAVSVSGEIRLAPTLAARAPAGATVFVIAKSVDSPGPPVAVYRGSAGTWPLKFSLDDAQSMLPGRNVSNAGRVTIEARISRSGQPLAASGDLQGTSAVIDPRDRIPVTITIDKEVP